ncbi:MAG: bifunctional folylpolyglutamate synthase/dihydrofolate synthase, partial [Dysgonamonadaceae bacterium]|nr:bifunctional folylpolyglutamate synthase/dihydrofolate synthase [Dysgonamonadaceae bacterium]
QANIPRALGSRDLQKQALDYGLQGEAFARVSDAIFAAKKVASKNDFIFVGGSTFVVAEGLEKI